MYFKNLRISGFKSFVDTTEINFEPGITAIVGPNGCGKSNILDSIRWVLGEQGLKAIRCNQMEDVIFNGSAQRKPIGMAEVSLTINNEAKVLPIDFSEVTVTRRLFRGGESEYLINKALCRLKDVQELFMDTGLGTDAYSIFEQGKMDFILNSKPTERRSIFEEAAGISKYKFRREETLRKLEATEQNLLRINDIVLENRRQINSLERQAKKAEKFRQLKNELEQLDLKLGQFKVRAMSSELAGLQEVAKNLQGELHRIELASYEKENEQKAGQEKLRKVQDYLSELQKDIYLASSQEQSLQTQKEVSREKINNLDNKRQETFRLIEVTKVRAQQLKELLETLKEQDLVLTAQIKQDEESSDKCQQEISASKAEIERLNQEKNRIAAEVTELRQKQFSAKNEIVRTEQSIRHEELEINRFTLEVNKVKEKRDQGDVFINRLSLEDEACQQQLDQIEAKSKDLQEQLSRLEQVLTTLETMLEQLRKEYVTTSSKLEFLEQMESSQQGIEEGARNLLRTPPDQLKDVFRVLADVVSVDADKEKVLEVFLGPKLQALLTDDAEMVWSAMMYLKEKKLGRAFFVDPEFLKTFSPKENLPEVILQSSGVLGCLRDFVKVEEDYKPIVEGLLGETLLVEDLEKARIILHGATAPLSIVTLNGEVLRQDGIVEGGLFAPVHGGLLSREREIRNLKQESERLQRAILDSEGEQAKTLTQAKALEEELNALKANQQETQILVAKLEKEKSLGLEQKQKVGEEETVLLAGIKEAKGRSARLSEQISEYQQSLLELGNQESGLLQMEHDALNKLQQAEAHYTNLGKTLSAMNIHLAQNQEKKAAVMKEREEKVRQGDEVEQQLNDMNVFINESKASRDQIEEMIGKLEQEQEKLRNNKQKKEEKLKEEEGLKDQVAEELVAIDNEVVAMRKNKEEVQRQLQEEKMKVEKLTWNVEQLTGRLKAEYNWSEQDFQAFEENYSLESNETRVNELREKIKDLGEVSQLAIEEYDELSKRLTFLEEQQKDLVESKASLLKLIQQINANSRELFKDTFEKARQNFKEIFTRLFNGGEADITLVEGEDVLEAGVEIMARPPGKKLQSVSLLSGGERALCAIAILFSLFLVRPSPFCVLDEVDAPLDDANVHRYTRLLEQFLKTTQFILITHSKLTMEIADVLYGVTMQEQGVSKIVSVKFKE